MNKKEPEIITYVVMWKRDRDSQWNELEPKTISMRTSHRFLTVVKNLIKWERNKLIRKLQEEEGEKYYHGLLSDLMIAIVDGMKLKLETLNI